MTATLSNGRQERFDLVVGADGLHSQVRELMFGPEARFETPLGCHVAAFRLPGYPRRDELTYVSHTVPKRQVARVALRDDETLVLLICRSELIDGDPPREQQKAALRRAFGDMKWEVPEILDRMDKVDDVYFDRVSQIHLARWSAGRVASDRRCGGMRVPACRRGHRTRDDRGVCPRWRTPPRRRPHRACARGIRSAVALVRERQAEDGPTVPRLLRATKCARS